MRRALPAVGLAVVLAAVAAAAPAHAAPPALPAGDALYTIECDSTFEPLQLFSLDAQTAIATPVGAGLATSEEYCSYDPAWDPTTGAAYGLLSVFSTEYTLGLVRYDLATGVPTLIGPVVDGSDTRVTEGSLTIGLDGTAYYLTYDFDLYTMDLATGVVTSVGTVSGLDDDVWALATDPVSGEVYGLQQDGVLFLLDTVGATATSVGTVQFPDGVDYWYGLTIDSAGTAWLMSYPSNDEGADSGLWSTPLASPGPVEFSGILATTDTDFYSFVLFSTWGGSEPQPQLAATGLDVAPLAAGAALLALLGALLVVRRRPAR